MCKRSLLLLACSDRLLPICSAGKYRDPSTGERYTSAVIVTQTNQYGNSHMMMVTPNVKQAVRDHFGCDTAEGAWLEHEGGSGRKGSHW